ncbi:hypothetical protein EUA93_08450 [Nocardioides oleivorans]|uniref:Uncharacterized protein n=1 Tax=Nocardioides oleivorans TaxID=273676 RepID=A0A4Q2RYL1_9ACTN|nr:hypothetical protein [Nocardioides oleivorans]RYB94370.1 hypothetical protein EUA93_08450 [Nocardioides oleivorans]
MTGAIRAPGHYAVVDGAEVLVSASGRDHVWIDGVRREMEDLDDLLSVNVRAHWRGGEISVNAVDAGGDEVGFLTNDGELAQREGLGGSPRDGWYGAAPVAELSEVTERVSSIHPRRREA